MLGLLYLLVDKAPPHHKNFQQKYCEYHSLALTHFKVVINSIIGDFSLSVSATIKLQLQTNSRLRESDTGPVSTFLQAYSSKNHFSELLINATAHFAQFQWKGINLKQSTRWQHLSRLKASVFFSLQKILSCYETQLLILGTGTAIWWVTEPH